MKTIIAGTRTIGNPLIHPASVCEEHYKLLQDAIRASGFRITEVVSGCARGVDTLGEKWAIQHGVPVKKFPAAWKTHGKSAGAVRNAQMGDYAEALIAFTTGSPGTRNMIEYAKKKGLKVFVKELSTPEEKLLREIFGE